MPEKIYSSENKRFVAYISYTWKVLILYWNNSRNIEEEHLEVFDLIRDRAAMPCGQKT
jgi:hypothetical protein